METKKPIQFTRAILKEIAYDTKEETSNDDEIQPPIVFNARQLAELVPLDKLEKKPKGTSLIIKNMDSFQLAKLLIDKGKSSSATTTVLNMASQKRPGGGWLNGARAQEECLFMSSNYWKHLPEDLYPLHPNFHDPTQDKIIFSTDVTIIKDHTFQPLGSPFTVNAIACSARKNPKTIKGSKGEDRYKYKSDYMTMLQKVRNIFQLAYLQGQKTLVLGAIGCGVFQNPIHELIDIYYQVIKEFDHCFDIIAFAILSYGNDTKFKTFQTHLGLAFSKPK